MSILHTLHLDGSVLVSNIKAMLTTRVYVCFNLARLVVEFDVIVKGTSQGKVP